MNVEQFFKYKEEIKQSLEDTLALSIERGYALKPFCEQEKWLTITIDKDDEKLVIKRKMKKIAKYTELYGTPNISGSTYRKYCSEYYKATHFKFKLMELREEITELQVTTRMQALIRNKLGLTKYATIECKVMALYKEGKISWNDVQAHHGVACSL